MYFYQWQQEALQRISKELISCYDNRTIGGWDENHITTQILIALKGLGFELVWDDKPHKVKWECHKLKSHLETKYGDIAVIVKVWLTPTHFVEGVAFYEAKRQYFDDAHQPQGFKSIKLEQLIRISALTHASHVLLYDVVVDKRIGWVSAISTPIVTELAENNMLSPLRRILQHYGKNWVLTLGDNLLGLHLDFRKEAIESIKKLSYSLTPPAFILNAAVGLDNLLEPALENTFINDNAYDHWLRMETPKHSQERNKDRDDFDFDR